MQSTDDTTTALVEEETPWITDFIPTVTGLAVKKLPALIPKTALTRDYFVLIRVVNDKEWYVEDLVGSGSGISLLKESIMNLVLRIIIQKIILIIWVIREQMNCQ